MSLRLYITVSSTWTLFLDIPVNEALRLSTRPVKWLRFLGWCIHGQPGHLTALDGSPVDEDPGFGGFLDCYYYKSSLPPLFIDVDAIDDRTSSASNLTQRRADFCEDVINRDGTCIITGDAPVNCTACHILPHAKGDSYVQNLMGHRGIQDMARVLEIDDVRNGLLLSNGLHRPFGTGEIAFLLTPNLYLLPDDVPNFGLLMQRLTVQHIFTPPGVVTTARLAPHNEDARLDVSPQAPSADILHFFYACAVLQRWGSFAPGRGLISDQTHDTYYCGDTSYTPDADSSSSGTSDEEPAENQRPAHGPQDGRASISDVMDHLLLTYTHEKVNSYTHDKPNPSPFEPDLVSSWLENIE
ncbi:hypothetical protein C8R43DRAFT_1018296 [Mycena crocata]|nr:hypothetical protein C8R43DRAFT_1018296 [Mycena crocata]